MKAVFLDRDGVLVRDLGVVTRAEQLVLEPDAAQAVRMLKHAGFAVVVITNQSVVARGMISEDDLAVVHARLQQMLVDAGGYRVDAFYFCPHHPHADVERYRRVCDCRKPRPGLIHQAAKDLGLELAGSYFIGDRPTDMAAGRQAGCRTILVTTGMHDAEPIFSVDPLEPDQMRPDCVCANLLEAASLILKETA